MIGRILARLNAWSSSSNRAWVESLSCKRCSRNPYDCTCIPGPLVAPVDSVVHPASFMDAPASDRAA